MSCSTVSSCAAAVRAFSHEPRGNCHSSTSSSSRGCSFRPLPPALSFRAGVSGAGLSVVARAAPSASRRGRSLTVVANLGGQYGDTFADVDKVLVSYFTFRALKDTLAQIQETDLSPGKRDYKWLYHFATENNPNDSEAFIKALFAQRQDYGQRILMQRQALFDSWQQSFVPSSAAKVIEQQNLEHLRAHLFSTVNLSEDRLAKKDPNECIPEGNKNKRGLKKEPDETVA